MAAQREKRRQERRDRAVRERDERRAALAARIPRLGAIAEERSRIGRELPRLVLTGGSPERLADLRQHLQALSTEEQALLQQHGVSPSALAVQWGCELCQDTGWILLGDPTSNALPPPEKCTCRVAEELEDFYRAGNIRGPQRQFSFDRHDPTLFTNPQQRSRAAGAVEYCREYADNIIRGEAGRSLVLIGDVGRGKTFLASAIANAVLQGHRLALYFTFNEFVQFARRSQFEGEEYREWQETLLEADLAVLDDLGAEVVTDFVKAELFNVVNTRLGAGKPMVICTNLSPAQIGEAYTTRVASRIVGAADIFELEGPDLRAVLSRRVG